MCMVSSFSQHPILGRCLFDWDVNWLKTSLFYKQGMPIKRGLPSASRLIQ